jgi:hypothetical protein
MKQFAIRRLVSTAIRMEHSLYSPKQDHLVEYLTETDINVRIASNQGS